ncbi:MAG: ABC transporter ATP-binding protein [Oscillospiraceae bacterium]|nr:ABC transporter ATP-binding protein [Oscillospiraceae bacterium]
MSELAIEVRDLKLSYVSRQSYSIKNRLFQFKKSERKEIEALRGVSFDAVKGEVLGVVGKNGSGKSTLLQTLAGVFEPDAGSIDLKGNGISLLSLGTGFQNELTGRENILLNGLLLGFTRAQLRDKTDEIIAFSELEQFIDMPIYTYSSGMNSKLAFSISAILETDILLVDEVLSVGDANFRKKSYDKMRRLIEDKDRTALIVSHQETTLRDLCDRVLWLDRGLIREIGETDAVLTDYLEYMK